MFPVFALLTLAGALALLRARNLVVAGLCLVLSLLGVAGLLLLLGNPVAAALQVIVYSGAIVVLVLFVIMLLDAHEEEPPEKARPVQRWAGAVVAAALGAGAFRLVQSSPAVKALGRFESWPAISLKALGDALMRDHLLAFEAVGLLLLAAMVGAVALVKKEL